MSIAVEFSEFFLQVVAFFAPLIVIALFVTLTIATTRIPKRSAKDSSQHPADD